LKPRDSVPARALTGERRAILRDSKGIARRAPSASALARSVLYAPANRRADAFN
jgi:hypothetical protein